MFFPPYRARGQWMARVWETYQAYRGERVGCSCQALGEYGDSKSPEYQAQPGWSLPPLQGGIPLYLYHEYARQHKPQCANPPRNWLSGPSHPLCSILPPSPLCRTVPPPILSLPRITDEPVGLGGPGVPTGEAALGAIDNFPHLRGGHAGETQHLSPYAPGAPPHRTP